MIDSEETDWKVLAVCTEDPLAERLNSLADLEREMPGAVRAVTEWLRRYKLASTHKENSFMFNGECQSAEFALQIVRETHEAWATMMEQEEEKEKGTGGGTGLSGLARARNKGSSDRLVALAERGAL